MIYKHGMYQTKIYDVWHRIRQCCFNTKSDCYKTYGGRGISIDPSWQDFSGFLNDMLDGYFEGASISRKDINRDFSAENCIWVKKEDRPREGLKESHRSYSHGLSKTPLYKVWHSMKSRCDNPTTSGYYRYGGRGISYTNRWKTFEGFYEDMGGTYKKGLTLEREDTNGNYCKENCVWIEKKYQSWNKCSNRVTPNDVRDIRIRISSGESPKDIAAIYKCHRDVIYCIKSGRTWKDVK